MLSTSLSKWLFQTILFSLALTIENTTPEFNYQYILEQMGVGELTQQRNIKAHIHGKTDCIVISGGEKASGLDLCQDCEVSTSLDRVPASLASTTHFQEHVG